MIKVLIVDDEPFIRQGLQLLIDWESYGFEICGQASNGLQALQIIKTLRPNLVIADIKMPEMNGIELAESVFEQYGDEIKIIILSGFYDFEYAKKAIKYHVNDYILKPIVQTDLIQVLAEFKTKHEQLKEKRQNQVKNNKIILDQHMQAILWGMFEKETIDYVLPFYQKSGKFRYVLIEMDKLKGSLFELYPWARSMVGEHFEIQIMKQCTGEKNAICIIVTDELLQADHSTLDEYINQLFSDLSQREGVAFSIYIGKEVRSLSALHESYQSCRKMKSMLFFTNNRPIYYYEKMDMEIFNIQRSNLEKNVFDNLIKSIEDQRIEVLQTHVEAIFKYFKDERIDPNIIRLNLNYLSYYLLELITSLKGSMDLDLIKSEFLKGNYTTLSMEKNIQNLYAFSLKCVEKLKEQHRLNSMGVLAKIEAYILEHYKENISLKSLGEQFYINSAYLGQIFKKHYNLSFNDYLNQLRIRKAAKLLRRTDKKVYEIAVAVGYRDSDYFISRFEKMMGETPLQYRKKTMPVVSLTHVEKT
ncbi:response regulator [Paenibacillus sp. FSL R10-2782]|uniref:response regulator transcription factor n=1 Tax=Paenibacillus sp. FSL R10-2782 TaxID=2954661 RepID=UPI0031589849